MGSILKTDVQKQIQEALSFQLLHPLHPDSESMCNISDVQNSITKLLKDMSRRSQLTWDPLTTRQHFSNCGDRWMEKRKYKWLFIISDTAASGHVDM